MNKCKWAQGDFEEICVNADCPMCADFCPVLVEPGVCRFEDRGKRTHGDNIRAMTDEELAKWIVKRTEGWGMPECDLYVQSWLDWLKQEVEE